MLAYEENLVKAELWSLKMSNVRLPGASRMVYSPMIVEAKFARIYMTTLVQGEKVKLNGKKIIRILGFLDDGVFFQKLIEPTDEEWHRFFLGGNGPNNI